ncbi:MAG: PilZ domain-containing protein [Pseudomonadota bacterium]|nr:PilZ domain-containing protein [Pseudomonadota bacterium]
MRRPSPSDEPSASPDIERRNYFRIEDHIGLEICRSASAEGSKESRADEHLHALRGELRRLDQDIRMNLATLSERDRLLGSLFKTLNSKLDTLARIITFEQNMMQAVRWQDVILSEGGLAFMQDSAAFSPGEEITLRMVLPPELYQVEARAKVLDISASGRVHTEFTDLPNTDRQLIARHVMRWQIRKRQQEQQQGLDT